MKKVTFTLLLFAAFFVSASAQVALPYTNGFDTNAEIQDWQISRQGFLHNYTWVPKAAPGAATAPNYVFHDYPVGNTNQLLVDDWLVSTSLNLTNGARLSLKAWVFKMGTDLYTTDSFEIWLLKGNKNPALATSKTRIASLRHFAANAGGYDQPAWRDTANIVIPPTTGTAYIAFRYTSVNNWFTVGIDNVQLTPVPTHVAQVNAVTFELYPNPASSEIRWKLHSGRPHVNKEQGVIINALGQEVKRFAVQDGSLNIAFLQPGMYYVRMGNTVVPFTKR